MSAKVKLWEIPKSKKIYMLAGWHQWADAGSVSSGLLRYLIDHTNARLIGEIDSEDYYLFQFPGTHDLVRPVIKYDQGYPEYLQTRSNEFYYSGDEELGTVFFLGEEPHMKVEQYITSILHAAMELKVKRIIGLGGVYGELPYDKERLISSVYSLPRLKDELDKLVVNLSDYHGGASIGSVLCKRAGENQMEYISFYAFVPTYDFSNISQIGSSIRIENDYIAWLGIMRRVNHMLQLNIDLSDLEEKSNQLLTIIGKKIDELDSLLPQGGVREYMQRLSEEFEEQTFDPLEDFWEDEISKILGKYDE